MNIIELAKQAGFIVTGTRIESPYIGGSDISHRLADFAALVRAEREWVDLTDEEILKLWRSRGSFMLPPMKFAQIIITAFKEKQR